MEEKEVTTNPMKLCNFFKEAMEHLGYEDVLIMWGGYKEDTVHTGVKVEHEDWQSLYYEVIINFILCEKKLTTQ